MLPPLLFFDFAARGPILKATTLSRIGFVCSTLLADQMGSFRYFGWRYAPLSARATELPEGRS
jgi:hypothetical protein